MASQQKTRCRGTRKCNGIARTMFVQIFLNKHSQNPILPGKDDFIRVSKPSVYQKFRREIHDHNQGRQRAVKATPELDS